MAELIPAPFADLVTRLFREPSRQDAVFELPRRKWYLPAPDSPDLGVSFQGRPAGNASGPAAGPHTQMAQNLLLSYLAGARIMELKTVQVLDRLTIPRPCIDMANVGYNVEWSQELTVEQSLREYTAGAMLISMFRRQRDLTAGRLDGPAGDWLFDLSVGYDLAGIRSDKVRGFLAGMRDASGLVEKLRAEIPKTLAAEREAPYPTRLSDTITLSTFHGCPADEIESICEFLLAEDFDVIVKMNPPTLGRERVEHLLHEVMGYDDLEVNPKAYGAAISFDESLGLCGRLRDFADRRGRRLGFKFSNTLEVVNRAKRLPSDDGIIYLSGQPLHVITMALTSRFREAVGAEVPISFSAGIDRDNFPDAVACGFVPVTVSSDLLRPGGYGRLPAYLQRLAAQMTQHDARSVDDFILKRWGHGQEAERRVRARLGPDADADAVRAATIREAGLLNTISAAEAAAGEARYGAARNRKVPRRVDSHLVVFDCLTCDKCLPVCPNAANFTYPTPLVAFDYHDLLVQADGAVAPGDQRRFEITKAMQIACYADFCNECGNCDTFCPEYGGPYIEKPSFFGSRETWDQAAPRDGFVVQDEAGRATLLGRMEGAVFRLQSADDAGHEVFDDGAVRVTLDAAQRVAEVRPLRGLEGPHTVNMWACHTMRHLLAGVLDAARINQVNASRVGWREA